MSAGWYATIAGGKKNRSTGFAPLGDKIAEVAIHGTTTIGNLQGGESNWYLGPDAIRVEGVDLPMLPGWTGSHCHIRVEGEYVLATVYGEFYRIHLDDAREGHGRWQRSTWIDA